MESTSYLTHTRSPKSRNPHSSEDRDGELLGWRETYDAMRAGGSPIRLDVRIRGGRVAAVCSERRFDRSQRRDAGVRARERAVQIAGRIQPRMRWWSPAGAEAREHRNLPPARNPTAGARRQYRLLDHNESGAIDKALLYNRGSGGLT